MGQEDLMDVEPSSSGRRPSSRDTDTSTEPSSNTTPAGSNTPTGSVVVPAQARDRSGTIIARPVWDQVSTQATGGHHRGRTSRARPPLPLASDAPTTSHSTDDSRPETETEDDGDIDMDVTRDSDAPVSGASSPERRNASPDAPTVRGITHPRRAVGIVSDTVPPAAGASLDMNTDAHIIISDQAVPVDGVDVADGIVSLETNDDFAMGAPPGAPGAINGLPRADHAAAGERTPRAGTITLPMTTPTPVPSLPTAARARANEAGATPERARGVQTPNGRTAGTTSTHHHHHHHHRDPESGPYRDEDVLLALQLLAYLSKYPHVRQAFYKQRPSFHPATFQQDGNNSEDWWKNQAGSSSSKQPTTATPAKETNAFIKVFNSATGRGKEKEKEKATATPSITPASSSSSTVVGSSGSQTRMTNVFSLVERFTYRPSSSELEGPNPPPTLPPEIQYWAGVIMRNACRKDDQQGGIRQCANSEWSASWTACRTLTVTFASDVWTVGVVSPRVCQMSPLQKGQILREGVSKYRVERRTSLLVQRKRQRRRRGS